MTGKQFKVAEILAIALTVFLMWEWGKFWGPFIIFVVMNVVLIYIYIKTNDALAASNLKEKQEQWAVEYANNYIASLQQFDSLSPEQQKAVAEQERIPMIWVVNTEALCNIITEWLSSKDFMQNKYKQSIIYNLIACSWDDSFAIDEEENLKKDILKYNEKGEYVGKEFDNSENVLYDSKIEEAYDNALPAFGIPIRQWVAINCTDMNLDRDIFLKTIFLSGLLLNDYNLNEIETTRSILFAYQALYVRANGFKDELRKQTEDILIKKCPDFDKRSLLCPSTDLVANGRKCFERFSFTFVYQRKYDGEYYYDYKNGTEIFTYIFEDSIEFVGKEIGRIAIQIADIINLHYDGNDQHHLCTIMLRNGSIYNVCSTPKEYPAYPIHIFYLIVNSLIGKHTLPSSGQGNAVIENN